MAGRGIYRGKRVKVSFNKRGLILCEGQTEENYFKGLLSQEKHRRKFASIDVEIFKPKDNSPVGLVTRAKEKIKEAKREKNPYDFIWVIFDKDGHARIPDAFEIARKSNPEIQIAFTIPCFEYFVLLHFEKTAKPYMKCDDVISQIKKQGYIPDYEKSANIFQLLLPNMNQGVENSKWIVEQFQGEIDKGKQIYNLSAYTNIHDLICDLYSQIEE
jgi:hypothetical protein